MAGKTAVAGVAVVQGSSARRDDRNGMIYTDYRLRFTDVWKGSPGDGFILMKAGGQIGDRATAIAGQDYALAPGERIVVFASASSLGHHTILGLRQGLYRVGPGPDHRLQRESEKETASASSLTLAQLKGQVFQALGKAVPETRTAEAVEPPETAVPAEVRPGIAEVAPQGASTSRPESVRQVTPWLFLALLVFATITWIYLRRRHGRS